LESPYSPFLAQEVGDGEAQRGDLERKQLPAIPLDDELGDHRHDQEDRQPPPFQPVAEHHRKEDSDGDDGELDRFPRAHDEPR
jgi:hypothetical protein